MNPLLREYLKLESSMLALDDLNAELADRVREVMDPIWHQLPAEDREWLNTRELRWDVSHGSISLPFSASLVAAPPILEASPRPSDPIVGWRRAA